ncbi:hypothetical protein C0991_004298 [Blastosporella zonata]|nr:hypothetical protein C0991_004298 [Blastosporella zonata]
MPQIYNLDKTATNIRSRVFNEDDFVKFEDPHKLKKDQLISPQNDAPVGLGRLFPELIDCIFCELKDLDEVLFFAVTCQRYYDVARRHIERLVEEMFVDTWAGDRFIYMDDYVKWDDVPTAALTDYDVTYLFNCENARKQYLRHYYLGPQNLRIEKIKPYTLSTYLFDICNKLQNPRDYETHQALTLIRNNFLTIVNPVLEELYKAYVLRNLSTHEYIRGDAIIIHNDLSFERVLRLRIMWFSTDALTAGAVQGPWAGHRFDFVRREDIVMAKEEWSDVSNEAVQDALYMSGL